MRVWIDQDCCTGAGLCVDHCPDLFIVLDDGIGYVHDGAARHHRRRPPVDPGSTSLRTGGDRRRRALPWRVHLPRSRPPQTDTADDSDIVDAEIVDI